MIIQRTIQAKIEKSLFKSKAIIIYGARQVGKTTLVKQIQRRFMDQSVYLNCDEPDIREALTDKTSTELKAFIGEKKLAIIDEAQRVENIGLTIKLLVDTFPRLQVIATGSSAFELSNKTGEPLTGRVYEFYLYPLSLEELTSVLPALEINRLLERLLLFGMYPEVIQRQSDAEEIIRHISQKYLFKDILEYQRIKNPKLLRQLLQALALQIGSEVSYTELATLLGVDKKTIESYIDLLEKAFIIIHLPPFSRNLRKELGKLRKIYFIDLGIRNAVINNLNPLSLRTDAGALWENFMIVERMKNHANQGKYSNYYFWRTWDKKEIDLVEEEGGRLRGLEIKWTDKKTKAPKGWLETYPTATFQVITRQNYQDFLLPTS